MSKHLTVRGATTAGVAAAVAVAMTGLVPAASAATPSTPPARTVIPKTAPAWLGHAQHLGKTGKTAQQSVTVYLAPKGGEAALDAAVAAVSTPGNAGYRHFLTPTQYYQRFAATAQSVTQMKSYLKSQGLTVTSVDRHNRSLTATGTAAAAESAFAVSLQTYQHDGQVVQAPSGPVSLPTTVAPQVLTVSGLDTTESKKVPNTSVGSGVTADLPPAIAAAHASPSAKPPAAFVNARPCSTYYGQLTAKYKADYQTPLPRFLGQYLPYAVCGYTGPQFRAAYEGGTSLTGAGVTVGIIDAYASPTIVKDANKYAELHGDGSYRPGQLVQTTMQPFRAQKLCGPSGWYGEETLDVEAVHAMAPDARIHYYGGASCRDDDFLAIQQQVVDDNDVQIVSNSYGEPDSALTTDSIAAFEQVVKQGAMQGISFLFSSGDNGDELQNTGLRQADSSASDPFVTAVGGTSTAINASGQIAFQTGWGTEKYALSDNGNRWNPLGFIYGAGGGYSNLFNRPAYQVGVVPANAPAGRAVPDVAMDADPTTGMLVGETQTFPNGKRQYGEYRIGGTSLASPLFAGMVALAAQKVGGSLGFLNPYLYSSAGQKYIDDVKGQPKDRGNVRVDFVNGTNPADGLVYSVRTFNQDSSLKVKKGWDDVTGLGVPNASFFTTTP